MPFRLASIDHQQVVLKRRAYGCTNLIPPVAGIVMLALGIFPLWMQTEEKVFIILAVVLIGMGLMFTIAGFVILPATHRNIPWKIIINHRKGVVEVQLKNKCAYIPYQDIDCFFLFKSGGGDSELKTTYNIVLKKKDGAEWQLLTYYKKGKAEPVLEALQQGLRQNAGPALEMKAQLPRHIIAQDSPEKSVLIWRKPVTATTLLLIIFTIVFAGVTVAGTMENWLIGLPFCFATGLLLFLDYKLMQSHARRFVIAISPAQLDYYEFSKMTGKQRVLKSMPAADIDRITYSFWSENRGIGQFRVEPNADSRSERIEFIMEGTNPVECLHIEAWLQMKLNELGKVNVK